MNKDMVMKNAEKIKNLIELLSEPRKSLVKKMFEGPVGAAYFTAPASTKQEFHAAFVGGLAWHSLNVVRNLIKMSEALCPGKFTKEKLVFAGLMHDLGKAGDGENDYYLETDLRWKKERGEFFEINKKCFYMPTSERGIYLLQKYGIELEADEYVAIRLNDGMYDVNNHGWRMKEPDLAILVHFSDLWSTREEKLTVNFSEKSE